MSRKWLIVTGLSVVIELYALFHLPALLLAFMFLVGRSNCSFERTLGVAKWKPCYLDSIERIRRESRLIRSEKVLQLWATPRGEFWMNEHETASEWGVLAEQELSVYGSGRNGIQKHDVVIDCGANIGTFTRTALTLGASIVVAVEPAAEKVDCLARNFQTEVAAGKVRLYPKGVWDGNERAVLSDWTNGVEYGESIELTTIDAIVSELKLDRVNFIKMDIEGAEERALEGARKTLLRFKPALAISCEHSPQEAR